MKKGYFIALEGGEGSGKSTIGIELVRYLRELGLDVLRVREPGGTEIGERIRGILKDKNFSNMSSKTELLLFLAARAQIVEEVVRPHIERGGMVVADRFRYSSDIYQGYARGLGVRRTQDLNDFATDNLHPDLTLFYDIDPEIGLKRKGKYADEDRLDSLGLEFHRKVRQGYLEAMQTDGHERSTWIVIDANKPLVEVMDRTIIVVKERLAFEGFIEAPNIRKEARG